jgi:hypothetical protein
MPQPPNDKPVWDTKPRDMFDPLYNLLTVYAGVVTPLIHSGFGMRGLAPYPFTLILLFGYASFGRCPSLLLTIPVWLALVFFRAVTVDKHEHSCYRGFPWFACRVIPFVNNEKKGRIAEAFVVLLAGALLLPWSAPLGVFVIGSGIALYGVLVMEQMEIDARKRSVHDARIEAERWADLANGGDGWNS